MFLWIRWIMERCYLHLRWYFFATQPFSPNTGSAQVVTIFWSLPMKLWSNDYYRQQILVIVWPISLFKNSLFCDAALLPRHLARIVTDPSIVTSVIKPISMTTDDYVALASFGYHVTYLNTLFKNSLFCHAALLPWNLARVVTDPTW